MTRRIPAFALGLLLFGMAAAVPAQQKADAGFRPSGAEFARAYNAGDAEAVAALYADDAVLMPPDHAAINGRDAIRDFARADSTGMRQAGFTLEIDDGMSGSQGNLGWHSGAFRLKRADGGTAATGKYVEVWERRNGRWLMLRDIWNMDAPMPPPPAQPATQSMPAEAPVAEPPIEKK